MTDLPFSCACGQVKGVLHGVAPGSGTNAICHCRSCRAADLHCGAPDPGTQGVGIYQTSPWRLKITEGADRLAVFSFGPKNLLRWQAGCCGALLFNTPRNPRISFVGIRTSIFPETAPLGPVDGHAFIPTGNGKTRHEGTHRFVWGFAKRTLANLASGKWRRTPFFDTETGDPVARVDVLPEGTRDRLIAAAG